MYGSHQVLVGHEDDQMESDEAIHFTKYACSAINEGLPEAVNVNDWRLL